jgi:hypothetical protein
MRLTNTFNGIEFFTNNNPQIEFSFYIGVSYNNLTTPRLLRCVEYFITEGLMGTNVECDIVPQADLPDNFNGPKGYIYISDTEVIRNADGPYNTRPTAIVRVSFSV